MVIWCERKQIIGGKAIMIDLMSKKHIFFIISLVLVAIGVIFLAINGLMLDITFQGGTRILIEVMDDTIDSNSAAKLVEEALGKKVNSQLQQTYNPEDKGSKIYMLRLDFATAETLKNEKRAAAIKT